VPAPLIRVSWAVAFIILSFAARYSDGLAHEPFRTRKTNALPSRRRLFPVRFGRVGRRVAAVPRPRRLRAVRRETADGMGHRHQRSVEGFPARLRLVVTGGVR